MNKLTYKEFEKIIKEFNCSIRWSVDHISIKHNTYDHLILATVNRHHIKVLDLDWDIFEDILSEKERIALADACWQLASTLPEDREEQKKYCLKIRPEYLPFFDNHCTYLNICMHTGEMLISVREETRVCKTTFTEDEINELAEKYDLSLFEKVEAEDE